MLQVATAPQVRERRDRRRGPVPGLLIAEVGPQGVFQSSRLHAVLGAEPPVGNRTLHGHARLDRWLIGWLAAFPDARLFVDHSIAMEEPGRPVRTSTRWWMAGTHAGRGAFGAPSGATVVALGVSHAEWVDGLIRNEWIVTDEVAMRRQIAMHEG